MDIIFVATTAVIAADPAAERALFVDGLGLPLRPASGSEYDYWSSEAIAGSKHFGIWPLSEAAESCFGTREWPGSHPVPQASIEFEVAGVAAAAAELQAAGHQLLHGPRTEPWGQTVARVQSPSGVIVGVCRTPSLH